MKKKVLIIIVVILVLSAIAVGVVLAVKYSKNNEQGTQQESESETVSEKESEKTSETEQKVVVGKVRCGLNEDGSSYKVVGLDSSYNNDNEVTIVIPSTYNGLPITIIEGKAFKDAKNLTKVEIESGLQEIGFGAFWNCINLESVSIPNTVTVIGGSAFQECAKLKKITLPSGLNALENGVFRKCYSLEEVTIPQSVTKIGEYCFENCTKLSSITVPSGVTKVGRNAFNTSGLKSIIFIDANGWRIENGVAIDLSNSQNNAEYFRSVDYYKQKNIEK